MTDSIRVNHRSVGEDAIQMESAAAYLDNVLLAPQDTRTTLPANGNGKTAYGRAQNRISCLGVLIDQEVQNVRNLDLAFTEFDEMMGRFEKNGSRHHFIKAGE